MLELILIILGAVVLGVIGIPIMLGIFKALFTGWSYARCPKCNRRIAFNKNSDLTSHRCKCGNVVRPSSIS